MMLGNKYVFGKDSFHGDKTIKRQLSQIRLDLNLPRPTQIQEQTSMTVLTQNTPTSASGHLFSYTTFSYCFFCCIYRTRYGSEIELNNEIISTTTVPCCLCCQPYTIYNKQRIRSGLLNSHCYFCQCFNNPLFNCSYLDVTNEYLKPFYTIKREDCSCASSWIISDMAGNRKGKIEKQGCCTVSYDIELPQDSFLLKLNLLSAIPYLP